MKKIKIPDILKPYKKLDLNRVKRKAKDYLGSFKEKAVLTTNRIIRASGSMSSHLKARAVKMPKAALLTAAIIAVAAIGSAAYYSGIINTFVKEETPHVQVNLEQEPEVKTVPSAIPGAPDVIGTPSYPEKDQKKTNPGTNQSQSSSTSQSPDISQSSSTSQSPSPDIGKNPNISEPNMAADNKITLSLTAPAEGRVIREFGFNYSKTYRDYRFHDGIDIEVPQGAPVVAAADGKVAKVAYTEIEGYTITIEHGAYLQTHYKHLTEVSAARGDTVKQGQEIGRITEAGSYLHFGITHKGNKEDPQKYLE